MVFLVCLNFSIKDKILVDQFDPVVDFRINFKFLLVPLYRLILSINIILAILFLLKTNDSKIHYGVDFLSKR